MPALSRRALGQAALAALAAAAFARMAGEAGAAPAPQRLPGADLEALGAWHRRYSGSRRWRLARTGIEVELPNGRGRVMAADRDSVLRSWDWFGDQAKAAAIEFALPIELILTTLATETVSGARTRAEAARARGGSGEVGAMQTLPATARAALGKPGMPTSALLDPLTAIRAGAAYMAWQVEQTGFDPPLVAAAYNAGRVKEDRGVRNLWKLRCYPIGTGQHVERFVQNFGDAMLFITADPTRAGAAPSFAKVLTP